MAKKGTKHVYSVNSGSEKDCLTVLIGGNVQGDSPPVLVLFKGLRALRAIHRSDDIVLDKSKSGWMTGETFFSYMTEKFFPWAKQKGIQFPIIVFLDGHSSHLTLPLCEFCNQNQIILIALLPNATHIYQPMDVGVIKPFKDDWMKHRKIWAAANAGTTFTREDFIKVLDTCVKNLQNKTSLFRNAFAKSGMS